MKETGEKFKVKNYDLTFEWSVDKMYCSELISKVYQCETDLKIGRLRTLGDFDLFNEGVKSKLKEQYDDHIPLHEIVISPSSTVDSEL